jgi:hypothetical protein
VETRIIGVNDAFAFAWWNQSLKDRSSDIIELISRTALLSFGHRVDETEAIRLPEDRQHRSVVIDLSSCPHSRFIIRWKRLLLPIDLPISPRFVKGDNILTLSVSD